ncbi:MAG TPA: MFS transporter [Kiloniellales bacterium]|nr:MFS transporter [Kiloniellales bacterium]
MTCGWILVLVCGTTLITVTMGLRQGFGLFLPPISEALGTGRELFALAIAIQNLVWGLASPFFGGLADRFGARLVAAVGGLIYAAGLLVMGLSLTPEAIVFGQFLIGVGLGGAGFSVVLGAVGRAAPPEKRSFALGFVTAGGSLGQFAFVPVAAVLLNSFGVTQALLGLALMATTMVAVAFGLRPATLEGAGPAPISQSLAEALNEALSHRGYVLLTVGFFVCGFQVVFIATHLPAFLADYGVGTSYAAWALALVGLFNIFGSLLAGWLGGRFSKRNLLGFIYIGRSLVMIVFLLLPITGPTTLVFGAVMGLLWLGTVPLTSGLIVVFFGTRYLATLYGVVFLSHQVGSFLGAWLGGLVYDLRGAYDLMWWLTIASGFVATALHLMIREAPAPRLAAAAE